MDPIAGLFGLLVLGFYIWLVFVVPAQMASRRGRSAFAWLLVSIFLSPFLAIALLLVLANTRTARQA